jgi:nitroreductase
MSLIDTLNWRYACKNMDAQKPVEEEKVDRILEAIRLTATSSGLQQYELLVITNKDIQAQLQAIAWNQAQVTAASHVLVFAAWDHYTEERINMMFDLTNEIRGFKNEGWEAYRKMLLTTYPKRDAELNFQHAARQAYVALGTALIAAAMEGVDSTPMEGFDPAAADEILGLRELGLRSVVLLPLGYRKEEGDWLVSLKKVRRPLEDFVTLID